MKRIGPPLIISLLAISLPIQAQEKSVRVDLGIVFFTLTLESEKNLIPIPISLTAEPGTKIARVDSEITFPASYLSFIKGSTKIDHAKFEASVRSDPENPEQSRLLIVVSSGDDQSLPIGVIAALEFQLTTHTPSGVMQLPHSSQAYPSGGSSFSAEKVDGDAGLIVVSSRVNPVMSCFFYMH